MLADNGLNSQCQRRCSGVLGTNQEIQKRLVLLNILMDVQQTGRGGASLNVSFDA
jgi:hypothetical protein